MGVRLLDDALIDQIAAGEVVERPASVVKELVENSLDAGATELRVRLDEGGRSRIQVSDNGHGMDEHDAVLCLERHATSKIRTLDDLVHVRSLGFRGEAIPSIASVSRFELLTRRVEDELGTRVTVEGGVLRGVAKAGCAAGTRITVRSLFYNLPVRRGFLRTIPTELGHCVDAVTRQVLTRPDVDVLVQHGPHDVLRAPAAPDLRGRVRAILGKSAERLREVSFEDRGLEVQGLVSPIGVHQGSGRGVHLYVNGRHVRDPVLRRAIREAYQGIVPRGRHPVVVLSLRIPDERVDVNVHPAKTEVRFRSPRDVVEVVAGGLREALHRSGIQRQIADDAFGSRTRRPDPAALPLPLAAHPADDPGFQPAPERPAEPELPPWLAADVREAGAVEPPPDVVTRTLPDPRPAGAASVDPDPGSQLEGLCLLEGQLGLFRLDQEIVLVDGLVLRARLALAALQAGGAPERLLVPRRVEPGRALAARLLAWEAQLDEVGLSLGSFGAGVLVVKRLPGVLLDAPLEGLLQGLAQELPPAGGEALPEAALRRLASFDSRAFADLDDLERALERDAFVLEPPLARRLDLAEARAWIGR